MSFRYGIITATVLCFVFVQLAMPVFANKKVSFEKVCTSLVGVLYVTVCFSCLVRLRYVTAGSGTNAGETVGQYIYLLVFIAAWITDTFAYFTGVFFGKHKLCPEISPKKTIEGSAGGVMFCVIAFVIYGIIISHFYEITPNYTGLITVGRIMSALSQTGDLIASVIKRNYGIKDYGHIFPGHGGVLDRFDSVLLISPFLLVLVEDAQFMQFLFTI